MIEHHPLDIGLILDSAAVENSPDVATAALVEAIGPVASKPKKSLIPLARPKRFELLPPRFVIGNLVNSLTPAVA